MSNQNYEEMLSTKEKKFNIFLNKTIILTSKDYYRMNKRNESRELKILDDENFEDELKEYTKVPETLSFEDNALDFIDYINDVELCLALKSLSTIEQMVIFLTFKKELKQEDAAKILNICSKSVSRIKKRALKKLKKYLEGEM